MLVSLARVLVVGAAGNNLPALIIGGIALIMLLVFLWVFVLFLRLFRPWVRAYLANAHVPLVELIGMVLRRTPMQEIVRLKIMAVQSGLSITTAQIESAFLQGADVERAILALIRARDTGVTDLTWENVISTDADERLKQKLYKDNVV
jgi:uncharacterized protein YqfA (UPF0365 family)